MSATTSAASLRGPDLDQTSEQELLRRAREGDFSAVRVLNRRHNRHLYRIARSVLADDQEAEDTVQETYLRAFTNLANFRGDARFSTWLARIVLNEALRRRQRRRDTVPIERLDSTQERRAAQTYWPWSSAAADCDPERSAARLQIRKILEKAIDDLPEAFRTVLVIRDIEQMNTEQTARILNVCEETVKTRLYRARRILRTTLGEQLASTLKDVFPFDGARCAHLTEAVLDQLLFPAEEASM
jgi:RNA polymerase sigma-70 factor (ECF subfamily)